MELYSIRLHFMHQTKEFNEKNAIILHHLSFDIINFEKKEKSIENFTKSIKELMEKGLKDGELKKIHMYAEDSKEKEVFFDFTNHAGKKPKEISMGIFESVSSQNK